MAISRTCVLALLVAKQLQATITVCNDYFGIAHNTLCFHSQKKCMLLFSNALGNTESLLPSLCKICIGNSVICFNIWHKYHEWYFEIVLRNLKIETILKYQKWYLCQISRTNHDIICIYYYSQNTTAPSQSKCRNFSCSTIRGQTDCILKH